MYERFTDRAINVMRLANQEAQRFCHEYIGTEHLLLGLVKEGSGVAAIVLNRLGIDLRKIRLEVERIVVPAPGGEQVIMGRMPHTPRTKKVVEYAIEEAKSLNHNYVGTEHILLGLLRERNGVASQVLENLGTKLVDVREEVLAMLGQKESAQPQPQPATTGFIKLSQWTLRVDAPSVKVPHFEPRDMEFANRHRAALESMRANLRLALAQLDAILSPPALDAPHVAGPETPSS